MAPRPGILEPVLDARFRMELIAQDIEGVGPIDRVWCCKDSTALAAGLELCEPAKEWSENWL